MTKTLFTSESVCAGHPDKIADAISDAILDELLKLDPNSRCGIETVVGADHVSIFGEVTTRANINYEKITRNKIKLLGYTEPRWGFSDNSTFTNYIHQQSREISKGVDKDGAGDQGMMFGYACNETKELMPLPITLAHEITKRIDECREKKIIDWLRPDGKAQVTVGYENEIPKTIERIVVAIAHKENIDYKIIRKEVKNKILKYVLDKYNYKLPIDKHTIINGTGEWYIPGPYTDAGLTGRKIVVDGYGGYARIGGGAFSGKDPSKVDRSGAYAARFIAKNIVANNYAEKCEIGVAYAIGIKDPLMVSIDTYGTNKISEDKINIYAKNLIDLSVKGIIDKLNLRQPIYSETSSYGHFGNKYLPWEQIEKN
jgi:S-adenosylmethionine synthetase